MSNNFRMCGHNFNTFIQLWIDWIHLTMFMEQWVFLLNQRLKQTSNLLHMMQLALALSLQQSVVSLPRNGTWWFQACHLRLSQMCGDWLPEHIRSPGCLEFVMSPTVPVFFPGIISGKGWLVNATICEQCPILRPGLSFHFIYAGYVPMLSMHSPSLGKSCQCYAISGKTNYMRWSLRRGTPRPVAVIPGFNIHSTSVYLVSIVQAINEINSDPSILEACAKFCMSIKQYEYHSPHIPRPGARDVLPNPRQGAKDPDVIACENGICISN